jgi:hypothetical protein
MASAAEGIEGEDVSAEQQSALDSAQKYLYLHSNISFGLAAIALLLMSSARYL